MQKPALFASILIALAGRAPAESQDAFFRDLPSFAISGAFSKSLVEAADGLSYLSVRPKLDIQVKRFSLGACLPSLLHGDSLPESPSLAFLEAGWSPWFRSWQPAFGLGISFLGILSEENTDITYSTEYVWIAPLRFCLAQSVFGLDLSFLELRAGPLFRRPGSVPGNGFPLLDLVLVQLGIRMYLWDLWAIG